jgi:hypothetical protein
MIEASLGGRYPVLALKVDRMESTIRHRNAYDDKSARRTDRSAKETCLGGGRHNLAIRVEWRDDTARKNSTDSAFPLPD